MVKEEAIVESKTCVVECQCSFSKSRCVYYGLCDGHVLFRSVCVLDRWEVGTGGKSDHGPLTSSFKRSKRPCWYSITVFKASGGRNFPKPFLVGYCRDGTLWTFRVPNLMPSRTNQERLRFEGIKRKLRLDIITGSPTAGHRFTNFFFGICIWVWHCVAKAFSCGQLNESHVFKNTWLQNQHHRQRRR